jgi:hypothetical protein
MDISFHYNWPPGNKFVSASFGMASVNDESTLFRAGYVKKDDKTKVFWQGDAEWLTHEQLHGVKFSVERGDIVVVDKKEEGNDVTRSKWDTEEKWPSEAQGATSTFQPWSF